MNNALIENGLTSLESNFKSSRCQCWWNACLGMVVMEEEKRRGRPSPKFTSNTWRLIEAVEAVQGLNLTLHES